MDLTQALETLEAAALGNSRLTALVHLDCNDLRVVLRLALDPSITFGIKKLPEPVGVTCMFDSDEGWLASFICLTHDLSERKLTGNKAQMEVAEFLGRCNPLQRKWTERILKQDLRIGIGAKEVNNALGQELIYLFKLPLALDYKKVKDKDLKGLWAVQPKLDGGRVVAICEKGKRVRLLSRTGKEWGNFESIRTVLDDWNKARPSPACVYLDGEVVSYINDAIDFQAIQKTMLRKDGVEVGHLVFYVFDACTGNEWTNSKWEYGYRYRYAGDMVQDVANPSIRIIPLREVEDPTIPDLARACTEFTEQGYEGAMFRLLNSPVENKRGKRLLKVKTFIDDEAEVIGTVEGQGKYVGMLGAIQCRHSNGQVFEVGSGFNDRQRRLFWEQRSALPRFLTFKYFELTDANVPRLPIFRYFRAEEDIG